MNKQDWSERFDKEFPGVLETQFQVESNKYPIPAITRFVGDEIKAFIQTVEKEAREYERKCVPSLAWITAAICPECNGDGQYYWGDPENPEIHQCRWCFEKNLLLKALEEDLEPRSSKESENPVE